MKFPLKRELPFWILILAPILYLAFSWEHIPETVPLHFNLYGEADRYGSKTNLVGLAIIIPVVIYLVLWEALYIDPKNRIQEMGRKYHQLRLIVTLIIAAIVLLMVGAMVYKLQFIASYIFMILGLTFILMGNFFNNLKPNYFIGIRTPWALENETIWRKTHHFSSKIWFAGGLLLLIINLVPGKSDFVMSINYTLIILMVVIPIIYSYLEFRKLSALRN